MLSLVGGMETYEKANNKNKPARSHSTPHNQQQKPWLFFSHSMKMVPQDWVGEYQENINF